MIEKLNIDYLNKIIALIEKDAADLKETAAFNGSHEDYGASSMLREMKFFMHGFNGEIPPEWKRYQQVLDPEYAEFKRLKEKFEA